MPVELPGSYRRTPWCPSLGNPQALNRYAYGLNNPVKYNDPTGHSVPVDVGGYLRVNPGTGNVFAWTIAGSGLRQVIARAAVGRDSASGRLSKLLQDTVGLPLAQLDGWVASRVAQELHTQFAGPGSTLGDAGFAPQYRDDYLYGLYWGEVTPYSEQTGHFLTAVSMGNATGSFWMCAAVGHEQRADNHIGRQIMAPTQGDIEAFQRALVYDAAGDSAARDHELYGILNPSPSRSIASRRGNSMSDLRLTVRGWRLGSLVALGQLGSNKDLANWIALNVAGD